MKRVVTIYAEGTPNPETMKFVADLMLLDGGEAVEFLNKEEAKGYSSMAEALFNFPFVKSLFFANNFVTITKIESIDWDYIVNELRDFVKDWIENHDEIIEKIPNKEYSTGDNFTDAKVAHKFEPKLETELDKMIFNLLEEYVKPAVESDGGAIDFQSFDEVTGTVTVLLRGSCSGCPSSTATLKGGIESLLKTHCPEVQEVVALEG